MTFTRSQALANVDRIVALCDEVLASAMPDRSLIEIPVSPFTLEAVLDYSADDDMLTVIR